MDAKHLIYIPTYKWMLEHKAMNIIERLRKANESKTIVLLDYNTCCDVDSPTKPLSHTYLVKAYAKGFYPYNDINLTPPIWKILICERVQNRSLL